MILSFDRFERYELPQVTLCNPNSRATEVDGKITITDTVGVLSNPKGMSLKLNFNAPHELSFDYYRHKTTDPIKQSFYDKIYEAIQTDRYVYLTDIGYFIISNVSDSDEDNIDKKSISLKSCEENELAVAEGLHLKEGTYYLHTDNNDGLLDLFLPKTAGWTMDYIDQSLLTKPYYVEDTDVDNGYNFLYTTIQNMFECIVEPDIIKRTISVYSRVYYAEHHLTDIHIAKYNLLKHRIIEENDEDKYTALNVQGKDQDLEIRAVNPTGKNVIYNFEPRYSWMSSELQQTIEKWQEKCESVEDEYLALQQGYYNDMQNIVFPLEKDIETLDLQLKQKEQTRDSIVYGEYDKEQYETQQNALDSVNNEIKSLTTQINTSKSNLNDAKNNIENNYLKHITQINKDCDLDLTAKDINGNAIFTADLLNELMTYIKPTDYVDEYMLVTESMTYPQRFEKAKELMDRAKSQLVKISSGQKTYSVDTRSFLFNKHFKHFSEQLCAGAIIYVETKKDKMEQLHLTGIDINFDEKSTNFTLGNKYDRSDLKALYEDVLGQNSKSFSELKYIAGIIEDQRKQLDYQRNWISDLRTLTLDNVLTSEDQAIEINNRGLIGRKRQLDKDGIWKTDENGNPLFDPEQVKLINNTLVFTNDNWQTVATAVGKIATGYNSDGTVKYGYGINGQVLIGELILGNNLVLSGTGAGIKIKNSQGEDAFYADDDGNLVLSGTIFAKDGQIAGWNIDEYRIYNDNASIASSSNDLHWAFMAGGNDYSNVNSNAPFRVNSKGDLWTTNAIIKGGQIAGYIINGQEMIGDNVGISGDSGKEYAFWAGMQDDKSPLFSVTHNGELNAKKGNLANITIEENRIYVNNENNSSRQISYSKTFRANLAYSGKNVTVSGIGSGWYNYVYKLPNGEIVNISSGNEIFIVTSVPPEQNGTYNNILKQHANSQCEFQVPKDGDYYAIINVQSENSTKNVYSTPKSFYFELSSASGLYTTNAEISGTINATYGNFSGDVTIQGTPIRKIISSSGYVYNVYAGNTSTFAGSILDGATIGNSKLTRFADYADADGRGTAWSLNGSVNLGQSSFKRYDGGFIVVNPSGAYIAAKKSNSSEFASRLSCSRNGYIYMNGAWDASTPDISDERKKNSISPLEPNYETLFDNLTPIKYKYNNGTSDRYHTGFIAQDVKKSLDVASLSTQDFAGLTIQSPNTEDELWALRYGEFVALNTWQIQRCKKKITDLENTVAELKTQIQTLTAG